MQLHTTKSSANVPTIKSPDPAEAFQDDAEDFDGDWGGFADDDDDAGNDANKDEDDPWGTPAVSKPTNTSFDDKGEPDFAGWLAAQNQTKKTAAKPLPKGLAKSSTAPAAKRPIVAGRWSTTGSTARKVVVPPKKEVKKEEPKANDDEVEGWGDDW